jgi:inner membrane protein
MPTAFTHAVVSLGLAEVFPGPAKPPLFWVLSAALAAAPDLDVLAFAFGVPYGSFFGHRGFFHSLLFAAVVGLVVALPAYEMMAVPWWLAWSYFFAVFALHSLLDGFTNGGLGVALLSPFDTTRYFFPWRPIQVSPIGLSSFRRWAPRVLGSEVRWVWLPLAAVVGVVVLARTS